MSQFTELTILKAEEKTLIALASKLNDQLNRLGVEEMALMSKIRSAQEPAGVSTSHQPATQQEDAETENLTDLPTLDLGFQSQRLKDETEEEEEEEEDEEEEEMENYGYSEMEDESQHDQLTSFLKQLQSRVGGFSP